MSSSRISPAGEGASQDRLRSGQTDGDQSFRHTGTRQTVPISRWAEMDTQTRLTHVAFNMFLFKTVMHFHIHLNILKQFSNWKDPCKMKDSYISTFKHLQIHWEAFSHTNVAITVISQRYQSPWWRQFNKTFRKRAQIRDERLVKTNNSSLSLFIPA